MRGPSPSRLASLAPQRDGARELPSRSAVYGDVDRDIIRAIGPVHHSAVRRDRRRRRAHRPEGGEPRGAPARGPADAGRLLPERGCLSDADRGAGARPHGPRFRRRSPGRAAASVGRDQARPLRAADRAENSCAAARRMACAARNEPGSERGALLRADRGSQGRQFRRPVRELSRHRRGSGVPYRRARVLGRAVDHECAPLHGEPRPFARGHGHGRAHPAAGAGPRVGRRPERDRRGTDARQRDLGARLRHRPGRGRAGPHRALAPGFPAQDRCRSQGPPRDLRPWRRRPAGSGAERARRCALPRRRAGGHARTHDAQGGNRYRRPGRDRMGAR